MRQLISHSQKVASLLRRTERALRDWQDDPDSPRNDVNKMLTSIGDLRAWVQAHVLADLERVETQIRDQANARNKGALPPQATDSIQN